MQRTVTNTVINYAELNADLTTTESTKTYFNELHANKALKKFYREFPRALVLNVSQEDILYAINDEDFFANANAVRMVVRTGDEVEK